MVRFANLMYEDEWADDKYIVPHRLAAGAQSLLTGWLAGWLGGKGSEQRVHQCATSSTAQFGKRKPYNQVY